MTDPHRLLSPLGVRLAATSVLAVITVILFVTGTYIAAILAAALTGVGGYLLWPYLHSNRIPDWATDIEPADPTDIETNIDMSSGTASTTRLDAPVDGTDGQTVQLPVPGPAAPAPRDPRSAATAYLIDQRDAKQQPIPLWGQSCTLGRATTGVDISIGHPSVSRHHAQFTYDAASRTWSIAALSPRPNTFVDGAVVAPPGQGATQLSDSDVILLGDLIYKLRYSTPDHTADADHNGSGTAYLTDPRKVHDNQRMPLRVASARDTPLPRARGVADEIGGHRPAPAASPTVKMAQLRLVAAGESSPGDRGTNNDVHVRVASRAAIADAVGKGEGGTLTARTVRSALREALDTYSDEAIFDHVHHTLCGLRDTLDRAASTLDILSLDPANAVVRGGHVGDGQVFRVRTRSDGTVSAVVPMVPPTPPATISGTWIGFDNKAPRHTYKVTPWRADAVVGDRYVMVTDGFLVACGTRAQHLIAETMQAHPAAAPRTLAETLVLTALDEHKRIQRGDTREEGPAEADNITVLVAAIERT